MAVLPDPATLTLLLLAMAAQPAAQQEPPDADQHAGSGGPQHPPQPPDAIAEPPLIIVTGSRIPRLNLRSNSPIQTVRGQEFILTGVPNVEETLNQMPQLVGGFTNTSNDPGHGAATLDLRGLGSVRTLILVNGRRWIASDAGQSPEVDVNTIPAALIERVDIVTGGASAVYGSDAVTGVVNFIFRDKLDGLHFSATQNITSRGDGAVSNADVSYGASLFGGRAKVILSGGWLKQKPVLQKNRIFSQVALIEACVVPGTRGPDGASEPAFNPTCAPPNERGFVAGGSVAVPGTLIPIPAFLPTGSGSALAFSRDGVRFDAGGDAVPFRDETDRYNYAPANYLQIGFQRWSANAFPSFEISPAVRLYSELSYIRTKTPQQLAPVPAGLGFGSPVVPVALMNLDNPFLTPASAHVLDINYGVDANGAGGVIGSEETGFSINPDYGGDADGIIELPGLLSRLEGLGPRRARNIRDARRALIGARGDFAAHWHYDAFLSASRVKHVLAYQNSGSALRLQQAILAHRDPATGEITCADPSNGCVPANIFGPGNLSAEAADFIRTAPVDRTVVKERIAEASIRGEIPSASAGPVGLVLGTTWRRTSYAFAPDPSLVTGDDLGFDYSSPAAGSTKVWELFSEVRVPLLAGHRFAHELAVELGGRYSRYDTVGGVWTWKALGDWSPLRGLRFRGGLQRAVRAPNVRELFEVDSLGFPFTLDPCAQEAGLLGNAAVVAACLRNGVPPGRFSLLPFESLDAFGSFRGNPDVKAEVARTFTLGTVASPNAIPGLTVTVDYYDIRIRNAINRLGGGSIWMVLGCILGGGGDPVSTVCQGYRRNPERGYVEFIDQPTANIPHIRVSGVDWQLAYRHDLPWSLLGDRDRVDVNLAGTVYLKAGMKPNEGLPELDCIGLFSSACSFTVGSGAFPKWKLLNQFSYGSGPLSLTLRHRWFSSTRDTRLSLADQFGFTFYNLPAEGAVLESRHYFDLAATAQLSKRYDITFGINNLTDRQPAVTGLLQVEANTDPALYDVLGRRFFVTVTARPF
ncbi:MAG: TonB-dependent receptor [Sphingomicrobium sp.]